MHLPEPKRSTSSCASSPLPPRPTISICPAAPLSTHESSRIESNRATPPFLIETRPLPCLFSFCATPRGPFEPIAEYSSAHLTSTVFPSALRIFARNPSPDDPVCYTRRKMKVRHCQLRKSCAASCKPLPSPNACRTGDTHGLSRISILPGMPSCLALHTPSRSPSLHSHSRTRRKINRSKNSLATKSPNKERGRIETEEEAEA